MRVFGDEDSADAAVQVIRNAPPEIAVLTLQIMEMMVMAQTDSTSGGSDSCGPAGPVDLMKTMMSGEDMEMFQNYMDLFDQELSSPGTSAMKGDSSHEWNNESYSE